MRKMIRIRWFKIALIILTFAVTFALTFFLNRAYIRKNTDLIEVLVATKKIPAYSLVSRDNTTITKRPRASLPPEVLPALDHFAQGKQEYTADLGFGAGDVIRKDRFLAGNDALNILATLNRDKKMLLAVGTNLVRSCAGLVTPGSLVNAVVFMKGDSQGVPDKIISPGEDARLANLLVLNIKNSDAVPPKESGKEAIPAVATLVLDSNNIETAKALVQYNEKGSIYLLPVGFSGETYLAEAKSEGSAGNKSRGN